MTEFRPPTLIQFASPDDLAEAVARAWVQLLASRNRSENFTIALSGGRITAKLFGRVVESVRTRNNLFDSTHFFWADERCVPGDHAESNYRVARESLFEPLGIPESRVHRIEGELQPEAAAARADSEIRRVISSPGGGVPSLDLVLLGMGEDGHVASLFPGESDDAEGASAAYRAVRNSPKPPPERVTLTYTAILASRAVWVLASGAGKQAALRESLSEAGATPCGRILRKHPRAILFSDIVLS